MKYKSKYGIFELELPNNWKVEYKDNVYSFFTEDIEGILQISAFFSKKKEFNLREDYQKELNIHSSAIIIKVGEYESIHYGISLNESKMLRYDWIIGENKIKLYCTFLLHLNQKKKKLDENYDNIVSILRTVKINSARVSF